MTLLIFWLLGVLRVLPAPDQEITGAPGWLM